MRNDFVIRLVLVFAGLCLFSAARAAQVDMPGPIGSVSYGTSVAVLPNGNFVVTDPGGPVSGIGIVYLYSPGGTLISTLTGSTANDYVGNGGIRVIGGNFVVISQSWHNGATANAGAVTWVNGTTGSVFGSALTSNVVSSTNSLVDTHANDRAGSIALLSNGNYVVQNYSWNGNIGAVTWCNADGSTHGAVSTANSLTGSVGGDGLFSGDRVGYDLTPLSDGNYVVASRFWSNPSPATSQVGATTWLSGNGPYSGAVSASNSLIGNTAGDQVGDEGVAALSNGHYVVSSSQWIDGSSHQVGAVTWRSGGGASPDTVSTGNSLFGTTSGDGVGIGGSIALSNGNYVVKSAVWHNYTGAATWGNGATGTIGPVSGANSLIGSSASDFVGNFAIALPNGKYVVTAPQWNNGTGKVGAAIRIDGSALYSGTISTTNALFGTSLNDSIGGSGVTVLSDGNYLVLSPAWNSNVGAATWGNASTGATGPVLPSNSLTGSASGDGLGTNGGVALPNGNYVVFANQWNNYYGAATWCRAGGGCNGPISTARSLHGTTQGDAVGNSGATFIDGNYVIASPNWTNNGAGSSMGAMTLANGHFRLKGTIAPWNSVIGGVAGGGYQMTYSYDAARQRLVVGRAAENIVSLFTMDQIFADDLDP